MMFLQDLHIVYFACAILHIFFYQFLPYVFNQNLCNKQILPKLFSFYQVLQMQPSLTYLSKSCSQIVKHSDQSTPKSQENNQNKSLAKISQQQQNQDEPLSRNLLTPANPIIDKHKLPDTQINVKLIDREGGSITKRAKYINTSLTKSKKIHSSFERPIEKMTLFNGYDFQNMLYRKYNNRQFYQQNKKKHFASIFFPIYLRQNNSLEVSVKMPPFEGMKKSLQQQEATSSSLIENLWEELQFNSNFESANLFSVFKTGHYTYDLVLQNDMNTSGCTQWFYFSVSNRNNTNIMAKFNIVNLYKTASLYNQGMKPMVLSSASAKGWKRKGQNIFYEKNSILKESSISKFYSSLSFSYDFTKENDTVEFAHSVPYTYSRLMQLLKTIQNSKKCVVKSLGITPLKKTISIIKFQSQDSRIQKKAIIFMARQHPGQVQGSFAIEQILLSFLKSSTEIDFLLWRFNVYIIPMINVDGVYLGNYRCNAMGYDLNRNWEGQQKSKHPQIVYIKKQIKKIMAKQQIQLILDLHGHSNKQNIYFYSRINSFFYGNPYGPNPLVFPYVASKTSAFVAFQECTFTIQRKQKAKTARSVLGNLIRETGNVYTYEMSFYGGTKNVNFIFEFKGKIVNFYQQNFRELGKDLITSIYKVSLQTYKEEKTLKESLYLKEIRKEIAKVEAEFTSKQFSGSDSEAEQQRAQMEQQRVQEIQQKLKQLLEQRSNINQFKEKQNLRRSQQLQNNQNESTLKIQNFSEQKKYSCYQSTPITQRIKRNKSLKPSHLQSFVINHDDNFQEKLKKHKQYAQKLKVFGQNYLPKPAYNQSQQMIGNQGPQSSMVKVSSIFQDRSRQAMKINFVMRTRNNRSKHQDFSTLSPIKSEWKEDDNLMNDIVRINRIQYKKIEREKDKLKIRKSIQRKNSNQGVFKLPSIVNNFKI